MQLLIGFQKDADGALRGNVILPNSRVPPSIVHGMIVLSKAMHEDHNLKNYPPTPQ